MPTPEADHPQPDRSEIEKQLLSAMVINNKIIPDVMKQIHPDTFEDDTHKAIFTSITALFKHGHNVTKALAMAALSKTEDIEYVESVLSYFKTPKDYNKHVACRPVIEARKGATGQNRANGGD